MLGGECRGPHDSGFPLSGTPGNRHALGNRCNRPAAALDHDGCTLCRPVSLVSTGTRRFRPARVWSCRGIRMVFTGPPCSSWHTTLIDRGGFSFTSRDSELHDKDLNFYKAADDRSLVCEFAHIQRDARAGKSLVVDYPVVITALTEGTWYEAAERYRHGR